LNRGINDFKKRYQPRTNVLKDEKGDLVANARSILARWKNYFSQLLNVHGVNNVRQTEIYTAEPLVPEVEMGIEKLKCHTLPGIDQIQTEMIKTGGRTICYEGHTLTISVWNKKALPEEWK